MYPELQVMLTSTPPEPIPAQYCPAGQSKQSSGASLPSFIANLPAGHTTGTIDPLGQYLPTGQMLPVIPSVGVGFPAPLVQKYPAEQSPV